MPKEVALDTSSPDIAGTQTETSVRRCALCKIDRKGRFILADREAEILFGLSEVELFGQPFADFLDPADHAALEHMISNRNPYETIYESARVTLISQTGNKTRATLVVSVNFGGGNPANYQAIINPEPATEPKSSGDFLDAGWIALLDMLSEADELDDLDVLAERLRCLTGVALVTVHDVSNLGDPPLAVSRSDTLVAQPVLSDSEPPGSDDGLPENEIHATFELSAGRVGLIRFIIDSSAAGTSQNRSQRLAVLAATVLSALRPPIEVAGPEQVTGRTDQAVAGALDQLGIGVVLVDRAGTIAASNQSFQRLLDVSRQFASLDDLFECLATLGCSETVAAFRGYLDTAPAYDTLPGFARELALPSGSTVEVSAVRQGVESDDRGWFLLLREVGGGTGSRSGPTGLSGDLAAQVVKLLKSSVMAGQAVWQKLEHEHHNELSRDGGFYLSCLNHHLRNMDGMLHQLGELLSLTRTGERSQTVDLGLLVDQITEELQAAFPTARLTVKHTGLPKITAPLRKLTAILSGILSWCADRNAECPLQVSVSAASGNKNCAVWVRDNGPQLTSKQLRRLFDLSDSQTSRRGSGSSVARHSLVLTRELAAAMGGSLELESDGKKGATVRLVVPTE